MMNRIDFEGRVAVVTGGAQGIGRAVAERLAAGGARIAIWDRDRALGETTAAGLGDAMALEVDVADWPAVEAAASATVSALGRIDPPPWRSARHSTWRPARARSTPRAACGSSTGCAWCALASSRPRRSSAAAA
jgi:NAD(P)-dependent dehydrogenase (short-subunit alcohol dehydrogenase family)